MRGKHPWSKEHGVGIEVRKGKRTGEGGGGGRVGERGEQTCRARMAAVWGQAQPEAAAAEPTASQEDRSCGGTTGSKRRAGVPARAGAEPLGLRELLLSL